MTKSLVLLAGAAIALAGSAAEARSYSNQIACSGYRDGQCVAWNRLTRKQAGEVKVGTVFGPNYSYYSDYSTLPQPLVTQYSLAPSARYVSTDGYVYVVDPQSYAVTRVITVPAH
ncbi:hypothetical protein HMF7854_05380 [Sphingomonas ginkgonis]|uniref:DUF1236 domain-containing protein n=1 Tax=Sphingomonas ginkgonis TaxID=2315330 RepID=A0A3R9WRW2_9SPHN|nr:hypothetical protein [Sphingomonas ginkgonis]RST30317.1 hypothetical protein HMF7854_05380 [Sphingomonas ginkgonis]